MTDNIICANQEFSQSTGLVSRLLSKKTRECHYIKKHLEAYDGPIESMPNGWLGDLIMLGNSERMKDAIRIILADYSDDIKWQEYDMIANTAGKIKKARESRLKKEQLHKEEQKKNAPKKF